MNLIGEHLDLGKVFYNTILLDPICKKRNFFFLLLLLGSKSPKISFMYLTWAWDKERRDPNFPLKGKEENKT